MKKEAAGKERQRQEKSGSKGVGSGRKKVAVKELAAAGKKWQERSWQQLEKSGSKGVGSSWKKVKFCCNPLSLSFFTAAAAFLLPLSNFPSIISTSNLPFPLSLSPL